MKEGRGGRWREGGRDGGRGRERGREDGRDGPDGWTVRARGEDNV